TILVELPSQAQGAYRVGARLRGHLSIQVKNQGIEVPHLFEHPRKTRSSRGVGWIFGQDLLVDAASRPEIAQVLLEDLAGFGTQIAADGGRRSGVGAVRED